MVEQEKRRRLEWFLRLINFDFESASLDEKLHLVKDMQINFDELLHPDLNLQLSSSDPDILATETLEKQDTFRRLQAKTREELEVLKENFQKIEQLSKAQKPLTPAEVAPLRMLQRIEALVDVKVMVKNRPKLSRSSQDPSRWNAVWPDETLTDSPMELVVVPKGGDEGFAILFLQTLAEIPLSHIGRCTECGSWFLQAGQRKRHFCSPQCRARSGVRKWRKKKVEESTPVSPVPEKKRVIRFPKKKEEDKDGSVS